MAKYQAPEGYLFSEESGLYYSQIIAKDENGKTNQIVTWFNADTGEYSRQIYPVDVEVTKENTEKATTDSQKLPSSNTSEVSPQPVTPVNNNQPVTPVNNNQQVTPVNNVAPVQARPVNQVTPGYANSGYQQPKKKSSTGAVVFSLICMFLIIGCIGLLWFTGNIGAGRDGNYDKLYATAEYKFKEGDYKTAAKFFKKITKLDATEEYAYVGLANTYYQMGENKKAAKTLSKGYEATESSFVYDEMQKLNELTGISFEEDTNDSIGKGLFSLFDKKEKKEKSDDDSSNDEKKSKKSENKDKKEDDSKKSNSSGNDGSSHSSRPEDVDYSRFSEIDLGYGTMNDAISGNLWEGFLDPERSNSGQSDYVIYDRYGGFLAELSAPSDFPNAEFHEYDEYCWWEFSNPDIWEGTITVSNYVTDERIRAYLVDASVYDKDMQLNGVVGYMYYEPITNVGIDCNFYGSPVYKMCYKLEADKLQHTCIVPFINSKGHKDFMYVEFTGNNYRFDEDRCLAACSEVFNYTTK